MRNSFPYLSAGFFAGLGITTKYPAGLVFSAIILAHFMRVGLTLEAFAVFLVFGATACLAGVFLGSPYLFFF